MRAVMEIDVTPKTNEEKPAALATTSGDLCNGDEAFESLTTENKEVSRGSSAHSKKVIKHALRQQAKRRKKNTTIASGNTATVPRIIVKPLPPQPPPPPPQVEEVTPVPSVKTPTMKEVLASIPGFSMKPRKRSSKKLSTAAQLEQTKEGCIDLETPDSILVNTNLRALLNKHTFSSLPALYQHKLVQLLPTVDRQILSNSTDNVRLNASSLNNEFFARACLEWQERLAEGEFTPENQQKLKSEADKERSKLDPWKLKHFEPIWGDRSQTDVVQNNNSRPPIKTTIKLRNSTVVSKQKPPPVKRIRTVGAVTRSCTNYKEELLQQSEAHVKTPIPDLLPIKSHKTHKPELVITPIQTKELEANPTNEVDPLQIQINESNSTPVENKAETVPEITIINISDSIINKNEETIISVNKTTEKRRRSPSFDADVELNSPKRKSLSPEPMVEKPETESAEAHNKLETTDESSETNDVRLEEEEVSEETRMETNEFNSEAEDRLSESQDQLSDRLSETTDSQTNEKLSEINERLSEENERLSETNDRLSETNDQLSETIEENNSETNDTISETNERLPETHDIQDILQDVVPEKQDYQEELPILENLTYDDNNKEAEEEEINNANIELISNPETNDEVSMENATEIENKAAHKSESDELKNENENEDELVNINIVKDDQNTFQILPNTLILQQESIVLDKTCPENCTSDACIEESAEKLEASVEESDLVLQQLESNFERVRNITDIDDANEDRFMDAENYVLESGQISLSASHKIEKEDEMQATLFAVSREDCCWDVVDSSTEKLLEVPIHALDSVPVGLVGTENTTEHVEVIPMQEELEVRLEEGTFPVANDWPYGVKIDSDIVVNALGGNADGENDLTDNSSQAEQYSEFSGNQVKLELEVTLTPEIISSDSLVTSTVRNNTGNSSTVTPAVSAALTTVIPPTTIVCFPKATESTPMNQTVNLVTQNATLPRHGMVQSSSALPYLALSTSQPIRAVPTHSKNKAKSQTTNNRNRSNNKPPPGAVNLERSYQICQAVIQNSPNRDQLRCQLKPPPSLLAAAAANNANKKIENNRTQYGNVTSSRSANKTFTPPLPAAGSYQMVQGSNGVKVKTRTVQYQQRQPSPPVVVRHVFPSGQGIPITMAVLPPQAQALSPEVVESQNVGQYILVQRAGVGDPHSVPRSSSAPPSQQQVGAINTGRASQLVSVGARGRPASVDVEHPNIQGPSNDFLVQCPNPGTQAVTRRQRLQQGVVYGDVSVDNQLQNYTIIGGDNLMVDHPGAAMQPQTVIQQKSRPSGSDSSCPCSLKAMVVCKKCGAFCHDDCIGPNKLCRTCFIR